MTTDGSSDNTGWWEEVLLGRHRGFGLGRGVFKRIPSEPRCKFCAAPFKAPGGLFMPLLDKRPWPKNPKYCGACFKQMEQRPGGAEVDCSLLFADVRGSTPLGERMSPTEIRQVMDRFFRTATRILVDHDAIVDKFVGDEVIGIFIPALTGDRHAARAVAAARAILDAVGHEAGDASLPVGAGVHTGTAFVGTVGEGSHLELTALGDVVNVSARLASAAGAGEVLVTVEAFAAADIRDAGFERRELELKGKSEPVRVVVIPPLRSAVA